MSYEPHTWVAGETVTAAKLNHMEEGIGSGGGGLMVIAEYDDETDSYTITSHTWQDIYDAIDDGVPVYVRIDLSSIAGVRSNRDGSSDYKAYAINIVVQIFNDNGMYTIYVSSNQLGFYADSPTDYPSTDINSEPDRK